MRYAAILALVFALAAGYGRTPLQAGLPVVQPPDEDSRQDEPRQRRRSADDVPTVIVRVQQGAPADGSAAPDTSRRAQTPAVDLDALLKLVGDAHRPVSIKWPDRVRDASDFAKLNHEQQNRAVPELLTLLESRAALPYPLVLPGREPLEVRHRAEAALIQTSGVCLGRLPEPGDEGDADAHQRRAEELVARWRAWWNEVKNLDADGREAVSRRERFRLLTDPDKGVALQNLSCIVSSQDVEAIGPLLDHLDPWSDEDEIAIDYRELLNAVSRLARSSRATTKQHMALFNFLRKVNVPDAAVDPALTVAIASVLRSVTKQNVQFDVVEVEDDDGETVKLRLLKAESIEGMGKELTRQAEEAKQAAQQAAEGEPPAPDADKAPVGGGAHEP